MQPTIRKLIGRITRHLNTSENGVMGLEDINRWKQELESIKSIHRITIRACAVNAEAVSEFAILLGVFMGKNLPLHAGEKDGGDVLESCAVLENIVLQGHGVALTAESVKALLHANGVNFQVRAQILCVIAHSLAWMLTHCVSLIFLCSG